MSEALRLGSAQPATPTPREFQLLRMLAHTATVKTLAGQMPGYTATQSETINQLPLASAPHVKLIHISSTLTCFATLLWKATQPSLIVTEFHDSRWLVSV